jgi:hypothetical protein
MLYRMSVLDLLKMYGEMTTVQQKIFQDICTAGSIDPSFRTDFDILPKNDHIIFHQVMEKYDIYTVYDLIVVYNQDLSLLDKRTVEFVLNNLFITTATYKGAFTRQLRTLLNR